MSSSRSFPLCRFTVSRLLAFSLVFSTSWLCAKPAAPHKIVQSTGSEQTGTILGVTNGVVNFRVASGTIGVALRNIRSVDMPAPPALAEARVAFLAGDAKKALELVRPVATNFSGLPTPWAKEAVQLRAQAGLLTGTMADAKAGYTELDTLYADKEGAAIGLARIFTEEGKLDEAQTTLEPLVEAALKDGAPTDTKAMGYGQAALALGVLREKQGRKPEALENYLLAVAVFDADPATVANAQARADALRKEGGVVVP